jgi:hypothetical protein
MVATCGVRPQGDDMTDDAGFKKAIRARMALTGERYTQARRALLPASVEPGLAVGSPPSTLLRCRCQHGHWYARCWGSRFARRHGGARRAGQSTFLKLTSARLGLWMPSNGLESCRFRFCWLEGTHWRSSRPSSLLCAYISLKQPRGSLGPVENAEATRSWDDCCTSRCKLLSPR